MGRTAVLAQATNEFAACYPKTRSNALANPFERVCRISRRIHSMAFSTAFSTAFRRCSAAPQPTPGGCAFCDDDGREWGPRMASANGIREWRPRMNSRSATRNTFKRVGWNPFERVCRISRRIHSMATTAAAPNGIREWQPRMNSRSATRNTFKRVGWNPL